jgi:hypothetical protein
MEQVLKLATYFGKLEICRAYGDWNTPQLSSQIETIELLKIDPVSVNNIGKNATDHYLLMEAGEILGQSSLGTDVHVFIIVSGDGDFASACELIKERDKRVIGIGHKQKTSNALQASCEQFYFLEDLAQELSNLEKHYSIPPNDVREFYVPVLCAYYDLIGKGNWVWVSYSQLDTRLHEKYPDYDNRFGKYPLSEWLPNYHREFEYRDQMIRKIDRDPDVARRNLLIIAYLDVKQPDKPVSLTAMGQALHKRAQNYENQFGSKQLSKWVADYPDIFKIRDQDVFHRVHWKEGLGWHE